MDQPPTTAAAEQRFTIDADRVIAQLGARIGQLETEKAQLEDIVRQLMPRQSGDVPQPAPAGGPA